VFSILSLTHRLFLNTSLSCLRRTRNDIAAVVRVELTAPTRGRAAPWLSRSVSVSGLVNSEAS
jgi:hypothetical protein